MQFIFCLKAKTSLFQRGCRFGAPDEFAIQTDFNLVSDI